MAISVNKVRIEDDQGNVYLPHSDADIVNFDNTGTTLEATTVKDAIAEVAEKATAKIYSFTLAAAGWAGTAAPYTQTVNVAGALASDTGIFDIATADKDLATAEQLQSEGAKIVDITINTGSITSRAKEKPAVDLPLFWQIAR